MISHSPLRSILLVAVLIFTILLTAGSLSSVDRYKVGLSSYTPRIGVFANRRHRLLHLAAFGGLAFMLGILGRNTKQRLLASAGVAGLGVGIEYLQHLIYLHPIETSDIRDDSCASLLGLIGALCLAAISRSLKSNASTSAS